MFGKVLVLIVAVAFVVGIAARVSHGAAPERATVVKPGDTLWSIAARSYAGDTREAVWRLQQRNQLRSATLRPGQRLVLP